VLCTDGTAELSAALMRGSDRAAGAVAIVTRSRWPVAAARAVLEESRHVLMMGEAADRLAADHGVEQCDPGYFVTERQRLRLTERGSDFERGTVGAVCLDAAGGLAAATSTGGRRGQLPGRVGDTPVIGAGTWADTTVAVSCTGEGEAFIRAAASHQIATRVALGEPLEGAAEATLADVLSVDGTGGLIAVDARGAVALPFTSTAMNRGVWRDGSDSQAWV
jgi:beta-aspartyl-peptidase (threonine type)